MRQLTIVLLLLATGVVAQTPAGGSANFTGTWVFDAHRSKLTVPAPSAMTLVLKQDNNQIDFDRTQTYGDQSFPWKLNATIGSQAPVQAKGPGYTTATKVFWQENVLVVDQAITSDDGTKLNDVAKYTILDNGNTLQAIEMQTTVGGKGANSNKWIYTRKAE